MTSGLTWCILAPMLCFGKLNYVGQFNHISNLNRGLTHAV